jgi:hypothetical protein
MNGGMVAEVYGIIFAEGADESSLCHRQQSGWSCGEELTVSECEKDK